MQRRWRKLKNRKRQNRGNQCILGTNEKIWAQKGEAIMYVV